LEFVSSSARLGILTASALAFAACSTSPLAPEPSLSELRTAPTTVTIAGATVELQAALWRNFQPIAPPDGAPLIVSVRLPQSTLSVDRIWVLFGDQIFSGTPEQTRGAAEWVLRDGPKWGPNVTVDVVVRVGAHGNSTQLLRAAGQPINAVF